MQNNINSPPCSQMKNNSEDYKHPSKGKKKKKDTHHDSNSSLDEKISGKIKFNNDQSSAKLFCSGVPVRSSLFSTVMCFNSFSSLHFEFFNLCPFKKNMFSGT